MQRLNHARILMYSHDTFGLGHLRRCRAIGHALVERFKGLHVLIVSGSSIAGAFDFRARVDFVKVPSVIKLYNGDYTSLDRHIDLRETLAMRRAIIRHTAESFAPDLVIVDKEPLGLRGEMEDTLRALKARGTTLALGLREVMDSPHRLRAEWAKTDALRKIDALYDSIWVYGPEDFWNPLSGFELSPGLARRITYTGYLRRAATPPQPSVEEPPAGDYVLVTVGGGGDGARLMAQVLAALEHDRDLPFDTRLVLGPFMPAEEREHLARRARALARVHVDEFHNRIEPLMMGARAIVAMGGYNTFCEILSFDKPALIIPRVRPREEQLIRTRRAAELGLVEWLHPDEADDVARLAAMLRALPERMPPSQAAAAVHCDGLETIGELVGGWLEDRSRRTAERGA